MGLIETIKDEGKDSNYQPIPRFVLIKLETTIPLPDYRIRISDIIQNSSQLSGVSHTMETRKVDKKGWL